MTQETFGRWGNNLAVRLPGDVVRAANFRDGDRVDIEVQAGEIVIRRAEALLGLAEIFQDKSAAEWRALYADAYDSGPDVGREIFDE